MAKDHLDANPVEELRVSTSLPFERARAMPPSVYTSQEFLDQELEHIFSKDWFCLGRSDGLANAGDYTTCELAGQPIAVIRDNEGDLHAMSNVCLHRMSTSLAGRCNTRSIVCPYHAWAYSLIGTLRGAPALGLNDGFCKDQYKLPQVRCQEWLGWVFVSLNADTPENFRALKALLDDVNVEDRGCTEKVYKDLCSDAAKPAHLSHLERPNYDFAQYLMAQINAAKAH